MSKLMNLPKPLTAKLPSALGGDGRGVVAVVRVHGMIAAGPAGIARHVVSAESIDEQLIRAFGMDRVKAVALLINSPGGSPTQSEVIASRIRQLAEKHKVPVIAFCEDVAASGGYWVACAADEIYAAETSVVGSIGVISAGFGFQDLMSKLGVERRVYTSGTEKARLDPFTAERADDVEWLSGLQGALHDLFRQWVLERRGSQLQQDGDLFNGDVWLGREALQRGLIDGVGSLREIAAKKFPHAEVEFVAPKKPFFARLGMPFPDPLGMDSALGRFGAAAAQALVGATVETLEARVAWGRFGR
ncbi:S49 family peptidase [Hoyosella subflava]|uniref:Possible signal peptide peptidase n=1 Tax=Hoyosella subflava (strain DSM 45089 / JCM 17490 / NBRC 109087 / DQS3-9A1) TaxID=443218 RepID=F6ERL2_HOYSD|nr:S49 family peptidase [Hoyosella subflava]AEF38532.1 Possible signal peptide peptidase [Hoyosella subflava DQS3-9A1]